MAQNKLTVRDSTSISHLRIETPITDHEPPPRPSPNSTSSEFGFHLHHPDPSTMPTFFTNQHYQPSFPTILTDHIHLPSSPTSFNDLPHPHRPIPRTKPNQCAARPVGTRIGGEDRHDQKHTRRSRRLLGLIDRLKADWALSSCGASLSELSSSDLFSSGVAQDLSARPLARSRAFMPYGETQREEYFLAWGRLTDALVNTASEGRESTCRLD